jgi:hypothetical protein
MEPPKEPGGEHEQILGGICLASPAALVGYFFLLGFGFGFAFGAAFFPIFISVPFQLESRDL